MVRSTVPTVVSARREEDRAPRRVTEPERAGRRPGLGGVNDPPNDASARFHHKFGFQELTRLTPPDGLPRVVWVWRHAGCRSPTERPGFIGVGARALPRLRAPVAKDDVSGL